MIPAAPPADLDPYSRETEFFRRFEKELNDEWTVYHGLQIITPDIESREIDFLCAGPAGILAIELKNARYSYQGQWLRCSNFQKKWVPASKRAYRNPVEQAESALNELLSFLQNHNLGRPPIPVQCFTSSAFLLQNEKEDLDEVLKSPPAVAAARNVRFTSDLNKGLAHVIYDIAEKSHLKEPTEEERKKLEETLALNLNLIRPFAARRKVQQEELFRLTNRQFRVLRRFERNGRLLLKGVAGSGKTMVALEGARRMGSRGKKVLMLCYSSNLAAHFASSVSGQPGVTALTMNAFCRSIIAKVDPDFGRRKTEEPVNRSYDRDFERQVLPDKALESLSSDFERFDSLILDEGQDVFSIENIFLLDAVLQGGLKKGNWLITYDPAQNLKGDMAHAVQYLKDTHPRFQFLDRNIRTPSRVYETIRLITGASGETTLSDITGLQLAEYKDAQEARKRLEYTLNYAVSDLGFAPEDIMVLSPVNMKHTEAIQQKRKIGRHVIQTITDGRPMQGRVGFSRIHQFKGLECGFVILTGIEDFRDPAMRNHIYVALTRTTGAAAILYHQRNRSFFQKMAESRPQKKNGEGKKSENL